ncbi:hypothetical protein PPEP_b0109 [Pseudoalteromonas peptidolytica F12-50-A1]|uniref:Uncharacterized protein n=1 Tax=Pseudoalteromonas peptidolytica F12-50-A1 TaxID=1315280 RepID=A0A8I0MZX9_9GAMM|nr:hypothetical protein [Pseudoalteromonas peptidolytica F12-50-A1]
MVTASLFAKYQGVLGCYYFTANTFIHYDVKMKMTAPP